jgi:hypothetical protein
MFIIQNNIICICFTSTEEGTRMLLCYIRKPRIWFLTSHVAVGMEHKTFKSPNRAWTRESSFNLYQQYRAAVLKMTWLHRKSKWPRTFYQAKLRNRGFKTQQFYIDSSYPSRFQGYQRVNCWSTIRKIETIFHAQFRYSGKLNDYTVEIFIETSGAIQIY